MYPLIGLDPQTSRSFYLDPHLRQRDEWAADSWPSRRYMAEAKRSKDMIRQSRRPTTFVRAALFLRRLARASSPGKNSRTRKLSKLSSRTPSFIDPPSKWSTFLSKQDHPRLLRYRRMRLDPFPIVLAINGLDSARKSYAEFLGHSGLWGGTCAVDGPGTGQAPSKSARPPVGLLSRVLDYIETRPEVTRSHRRHGVSWRVLGNEL